MGKKNLASLLVAALFCAGSIILCDATAADALTLKVGVQSVDFDPDGHVRIEVVAQGFAQLLGKYPAGVTVYPEANEGVTASIVDGIVKWDIKRPGAEMSIPVTVTLPNIPDKKFKMKFTGVTPEGKTFDKDFTFYTKKENAKKEDASAASSGTNTTETVASSPAPILRATAVSAPVLSTSAPQAGSLFGKTRLQVGAAWMHEFDAYRDNGVALGYPRSFTNVDGSLMTQLADSQWDFGLAGGAYRSPSLISKNQELLASFGRSVLRVGPVLRYRSNKSNNTILEAMVGVNSGDQIQGTNYFSTSAQWEQKIGNPLLRALGVINATGSVFPKRYALQNTLRGTLNGALESWSIQEQLDAPLPVFDAKGNVSPLALSMGLTWNAIWDKNGKLPTHFRNSLDVYPWVGVTYRFGSNNQSNVTVAGAKGDDYKGGGETPLGLLTTGTLVLEGGDREIKNVDMSAFDEEE